MRQEMKEHDSKVEKRLRTIVNNLPGMAYRCRNNEDWTMNFVSNGSIELTGYHPSEIEYSAEIAFADMIHEDDRQMVWDEVQKAINTGEPFELKYRILTKDGIPKWVREQGQTADDADEGRVLEGFITDITNEKEAEERLKGVLHVAVNAMISVNENLVIESVNPAAKTIFGYSGEEMAGLPFGSLFSCGENFAKTCIENAQEKLIGTDGDISGQRKDKQHFPIEMSAGKVALANTDIYAVIIRDISERIEVEKERRLNEERYRSLVKATSDIVWNVGPEGDFLTRQKEWEQYTGHSWEESKGKRWLQGIHEDDRAILKEQIEAAIKSKKASELNGRIWCKETQQFHYSDTRAVPILKEDGSIREWVGITRDIHSRQIAENKIKESEKRFSLVFNASNTCLWEMDLISRHVEWNDAFETQFADGNNPNETDPLDWWIQRVHKADRERIIEEFRYAAHETNDKSWACEYQFKNSKGKFVPVKAFCALYRGDSGETIRVIGTLEDISEQRMAEEAILKATEDLQKRIGSDIHDGLCQEIFGIRCEAQVLEEDLAEKGLKDKAEQASAIVTLLKETNHNARMTSRGLFPSALDTGGLVDALDQLAKRIDTPKGVRCEFQYQSPGPDLDQTPQIQLYRIAQEAVNNAIKHGQAEKIFINLFEGDDTWELTIEDDGVGIPENTNPEGIGFLSMDFRAKSIGATLKITNRRTKGTRVTVCFSPSPNPVSIER